MVLCHAIIILFGSAKMQGNAEYFPVEVAAFLIDENIHQSPASLIVFCYLATNMSRYYKHGGYMNIHPHSLLTIHRRNTVGKTAIHHQQQKRSLLKVCLRMSHTIKTVMLICMEIYSSVFIGQYISSFLSLF